MADTKQEQAPAAPDAAVRRKHVATQLDKMLVRQLAEAERRVGKISEEEVAAVMPEARRIYAIELAKAPHPQDAATALDVREWAIMGIAINIVARGRGYDTARVLTPDERAARERRWRDDGPPDFRLESSGE